MFESSVKIKIVYLFFFGILFMNWPSIKSLLEGIVSDTSCVCTKAIILFNFGEFERLYAFSKILASPFPEVAWKDWWYKVVISSFQESSTSWKTLFLWSNYRKNRKSWSQFLTGNSPNRWANGLGFKEKVRETMLLLLKFDLINFSECLSLFRKFPV